MTRFQKCGLLFTIRRIEQDGVDVALHHAVGRATNDGQERMVLDGCQNFGTVPKHVAEDVARKEPDLDLSGFGPENGPELANASAAAEDNKAGEVEESVVVVDGGQTLLPVTDALASDEEVPATEG